MVELHWEMESSAGVFLLLIAEEFLEVFALAVGGPPEVFVPAVGELPPGVLVPATGELPLGVLVPAAGELPPGVLVPTVGELPPLAEDLLLIVGED